MEERGLGEPVHAVRTHQPGGRPDIDDAPPARGLHVGGNELGGEVHGFQIRVHHVVPVRLGEAAERHVVERPGIVHDDAGRAQALPHLGDEAPHVVRARDIRRKCLGHAALGPDGRGDILAGGAIGAVVHRHAGAGPGEVARDVDARAVRGARDESDVAGQRRHGSTSSDQIDVV